MRWYFFGDEASTEWSRQNLEAEIKNYEHLDEDIRDWDFVSNMFQKRAKDIKVVIHAAAQPSHDWAAREPLTNFYGQCERNPESLGGNASPLPGCPVHFYQHQ